MTLRALKVWERRNLKGRFCDTGAALRGRVDVETWRNTWGEEENELWEDGEKEREGKRSRQKPLQGEIMRRRTEEKDRTGGGRREDGD